MQEKVPTHAAIRDYWIARGEQAVSAEFNWWVYDNMCEGSVGCYVCWCCGRPKSSMSGLQKCHIIPKALGGSNHHENLFLMCSQCHAKAPDTLHPRYFQEFVRNHGSYMAAWARQIIEAVKAGGDFHVAGFIESLKSKLDGMGDHAGTFTESSRSAIINEAMTTQRAAQAAQGGVRW